MRVTALISAVFALSAGAALADAACVAHPKDQWLKQDDFKKQLEAQGYSIRKFKVSGDCYEIYGKDKSGKQVEIYFDTVTGKPVKTELGD